MGGDHRKGPFWAYPPTIAPAQCPLPSEGRWPLHLPEWPRRAACLPRVPPQGEGGKAGSWDTTEPRRRQDRQRTLFGRCQQQLLLQAEQQLLEQTCAVLEGKDEGGPPASLPPRPVKRWGAEVAHWPPGSPATLCHRPHHASHLGRVHRPAPPEGCSFTGWPRDPS